MSEEEKTFKSIDEIPRHQMSNPFNLTEEQIARRRKEVKAAARDYPNVPEYYIELMWNLIETQDPTELDKMMSAKKKERNLGIKD